jgi:predicted small lipoprotein YifL
MRARLAALLLLALLAGGCGMKGDLYFPEREAAPSEKAEGEPEEDET